MSEPASPPKTKKRFKWLIRLSAALVVYTVVGFFVVPAIIKSQMLKRLPDLTKRQATIETVKFNPYALSLTVDGLALKETNGEVFSSFDEFYGNFQPLDSLFHLAWVFENVHLQKPFFQITYHADTTFNFANLISTNLAAPKATNAPPLVLPSLVIHSLSISNGAVAFADLTRPVPFRTEITPIDFSLTNLATIRDRNSPYIFLARTAAGETFAWSGSVTVNPLSSDGSIRLATLPLSRYTTYSHEYGRLDFSNGVVTVMADYHFSSGTNGLALAVSNASVEVSQLDLKMADNGTHLAVTNLEVNFRFDAHGANNQPLDISITNATIAFSNLRIHNSDNDFRIATFLATNIWANVLEKNISVGLVKVSQGVLFVQRNHDGTINLVDLIPSKKTSKEPADSMASKDSEGVPFAVRVNEIVLQDYNIVVYDRKPSRMKNFALGQINLDLKGVSNQTNNPIKLNFSSRLENSGSLASSGTITLIPPSADVQISLSNIDLRAIQPYVEDHLKLAITSGALNVDGRARYASPEPGAPLITFKGNAGITNFDTADDVLFKDFLKWNNLAVNGIDVQIQPDKFKIDEVKFTGLNTSIIIGPDHRANLQTILRDQLAAATNITANASPISTPAEIKKPEVTLGTLAFDNASLHFSDQSIDPHSTFDIQQFGGEIKGLSSQEDSTATVDVRGKVDALSPFSVSGKLNPLGKDLYVDVTIAFTNTDLTAFTPYTEKFVGRPLQKGKFSFGVHYAIEKKQLKAENGLFVDQLSFGPKNDSTNATSLPVSFAVKLLKDRKGRIKLDVPLSGRTDDPKFDVVPIVWHVIYNLILKAATSPFSLLGSLVGGGAELSYVSFAPAQSVIPETETNKLDKLAKALYERPELTVELNGSVNPALDHDALARLKLEQQLKARYIKGLSDAGQPVMSLEQVQLDPANRARLLALVFKETMGDSVPAVTNSAPVLPMVTNQPVVKSGKPKPGLFPVLMYTYDAKFAPIKEKPAAPVMPATSPDVAAIPSSAAADMESQLLAKIVLTQDDWRELMKQRAAAVQAYLLKTGQVSADRLFITAPKPMISTSTGEDKVNLTLD